MRRNETDTASVPVEEKVIVDTEAEEKLAIANEFFILDDPEEDVQQTANDINRQPNHKDSPPSTEISSTQGGRRMLVISAL
jgi:hypothetical protein